MKEWMTYVVFAVFVCVALPLALSIFLIGRAHTHTYNEASVPTAEVALVLGASVTSKGVLSPVLQQRADAAARLYRSYAVSKILVSGDNATADYDEVYPVGKYLESLGIPRSDIFLDYAGFDTYSSMYRAKEVFAVKSMIVVTQRFHLPRALFIARSLGMDAWGVDASTSDDMYFLNAVREIPASVKAAWDVVVHRKPKFLGEQFPISGSGAETWVASTTQMIYFKDDPRYKGR